jgi:outer membrane protein OmpA-like peptidoglycan-associated protein
MKKQILLLLILTSAFALCQVGVNLTLTGNVTDFIKKSGIKSSIKILDINAKVIARPVTSNEAAGGVYSISGLKPGQKVILRIESNGYFATEIDVELPNSKEYAEISKDIELKPMAVGVELPLKIKPFDPKKSKLKTGIDYIFESILIVMKKNPQAKFEICCYADDNNNQTSNQTLTQERANLLKNYLVEKGIATDRLNPVGFGFTDKNNPPPDGKAAKGKRYKGSIYFKILSL